VKKKSFSSEEQYLQGERITRSEMLALLNLASGECAKRNSTGRAGIQNDSVFSGNKTMCAESALLHFSHLKIMNTMFFQT
jgi:hypothetical protein